MIYLGCECLTYTKTYGKEAGTFNSPDYPNPYPASIDCLLYTFVADTNAIVEITFKDFNVFRIPTQRYVYVIVGRYIGTYVCIYIGVPTCILRNLMHTNKYRKFSILCTIRYTRIPHVIDFKQKGNATQRIRKNVRIVHM